MNKVIILGRLVKDVELKEITTKNGDEMKLGIAAIAVNHNKEETSFFDLKLFGRNAESMAELVGKGNRVLIEGTLKQESFTTKDGQARTKSVINVGRFDVVDFRSKEKGEEELGF